MFNALPAYPGGKRKLVASAFKDLPPPEEAPTLIDGFLGGGAFSLFAKARGYRVLCNDVALRSYIVGKALIENHHARLTYDDLVKLSMPTEETGYAERTLAPEVFPLGHARYLDLFLANAGSLRGNKRWLALLLVIKHALRLRPMGNFGAKTVMLQAAAGQWEDMNPHYVNDLVNRGLPRHPVRLAEKLIPKINAGVFSNDKLNEAHQGDVLEFLGKVEGDICYLDPPYSGTQSYERAMKPLDELLNGGPLPPVSNPYSSEAPEVILPPLFEAAGHVPVLVLSYGNQKVDLVGLMDLMRRHRLHVTGEAVDYIHCTGLSGAESRAKNQELLVIGRND